MSLKKQLKSVNRRIAVLDRAMPYSMSIEEKRRYASKDIARVDGPKRYEELFKLRAWFTSRIQNNKTIKARVENISTKQGRV